MKGGTSLRMGGRCGWFKPIVIDPASGETTWCLPKSGIWVITTSSWRTARGISPTMTDFSGSIIYIFFLIFNFRLFKCLSFPHPMVKTCVSGIYLNTLPFFHSLNGSLLRVWSFFRTVFMLRSASTSFIIYFWLRIRDYFCVLFSRLLIYVVLTVIFGHFSKPKFCVFKKDAIYRIRS